MDNRTTPPSLPRRVIEWFLNDPSAATRDPVLEQRIGLARWLGIVASAIAIPFLVADHSWLLAYVCLAIASQVNLIFTTRTRATRAPNWLRVLYACGIFDLLVATAMIIATGGASSPFILGYFPIVVNTAIRFGARAGLLTGVVGMAGFVGAVVAIGQEVPSAPVYQLGGSFLLVTATLSSLLSHRVRRAEQALARQLEQERALNHVLETLASSLDYQTTLDTVARMAVPFLADWCAIDLIEPDGSLRQMALAHNDPTLARRLSDFRARYPIDPNSPHVVARVLRTGQSALVPELTDTMLRATIPAGEYQDFVRSLGFVSALCVPLVTRGRMLGTLLLRDAESGRRFDATDLALAEALARRAAVAIENARLHAAEQQARGQAEQAQHHLRFLAEASAVLASSLDYETTLDRVARLALPTLADYCSINLFDKDGTIRRVTAAHVDPTQAPLVAGLQHHPPNPTNQHSLVVRALQTGRTVQMLDMPATFVDALAQDPDHATLVRALGATAALVVPLVARGRTLGAISLVMTTSGRRHEPPVRALAEELANRAAMAIDNALLYREAWSTLAALRQSQAQLVHSAKLAAIGTLAAGVAHELNQPLMVIRGQAQLLASADVSEAQLRRLDRVERSTLKMEAIISHLRAFGRANPEGSGQLVSLSALIPETLLFIGTQLRERDIDLRLDLAPAEPTTLADPSQIEQIILNLLANARDATPPGGAITLRTWAEETTVHLSVADTGAGIPPAVLERLFEPFYTTKPVGMGTGLGLSISRDLARSWGGDLSLTNQPTGGALALLQLPRHAAPEAAPGSAAVGQPALVE